ncbi:hypothetical protein [Cupriavidus alkaliphilus]|uniref:hypothetical protein n=1 Tax=Cupriavidus alkaliphilus TaxID=942866 RepID=UPI00160E0A58|nr:hypothetical protein [Cupriavidus alkaliphilus]MBB3013160.1 hypothetical protein [Cupriavidus alkaliphilus]
MKILSPSECSIWLKREDCCENPYGRRSFSSASSLQFATSRAEGAVSRMVHGIRTILGSPRSYLFQVTDWSRYVEHENSNLSDLKSKGSGNPFDAWGIVFEAGEADEMFECCISVVDCGMSAYLYAPQIATILFWEGNLVDVWTNEPELRNQLAQWARNEQFRITRF